MPLLSNNDYEDMIGTTEQLYNVFPPERNLQQNP